MNIRMYTLAERWVHMKKMLPVRFMITIIVAAHIKFGARQFDKIQVICNQNSKAWYEFSAQINVLSYYYLYTMEMQLQTIHTII